MPTENIWNLTVMHWLVYSLHVVCDHGCFPVVTFCRSSNIAGIEFENWPTVPWFHFL